MKINNNLDKNLQVIDILKQRDFLVIFKKFIISLEKQDKFLINDKFDILLKILKSNDFKNNLKSTNNYNLFQIFGRFFSDPSLKQTFIIYVQENKFFNIDQKYLNTYLDVFDYLEELFDIRKDYPADIFDVSGKYKEKITDVVGNRGLIDQKLFLKNGYPISIEIDDKTIYLQTIDLNNFITFNDVFSESTEETIKYCLVYDVDNNSYYEGITGEILYDDRGNIIRYIDMESIMYFVDKKVFTYTNNVGENCIGFIDLFGFGNIERLDGQDFIIDNKSYFDEKLDKEIKLDYIKIIDNGKSSLYNSKLEDLSVLDLVLFLESDGIKKKYIEMTLEKLKEIDNIRNIYAVHNFNGKKFIELELGYELSDDYGNVMFKYDRCIIDDSGVIFEDKKENIYIQELLNEEYILGKTFVGYGNIDGFIDANGIVLKYKKQVKHNINLPKITKEEAMFSIEEMPFSVKGEKYFKINGNDFISENNLKKILESYTSFEERDKDIVEIYLDETIEIEGENISKITAKLDDIGVIKYFVSISGQTKKIEKKGGKLVFGEEQWGKIEKFANDIFKSYIFTNKR